MIPPFNEFGELPPGVHEATFAEVVRRFGHNDRRRMLLACLSYALKQLSAAGAECVYVGGSFVTAREYPGDIDAVWLPGSRCDRGRLGPEFLDEAGSLRPEADIPGLHLFADLLGGILAVDWLSQVRAPAKRRKGVVLLRLHKAGAEALNP
ncbi:MAG: hypothetical protein FJX75_27690 [Armatimonadetes bacterium]|nr:hypothetical protein [Armatimonadota bacterium]